MLRKMARTPGVEELSDCPTPTTSECYARLLRDVARRSRPLLHGRNQFLRRGHFDPVSLGPAEDRAGDRI